MSIAGRRRLGMTLLTQKAKTAQRNHVCSIEAIRDEVCQLVCEGRLSRLSPLCTICGYFSEREWPEIESELERNDYLLRDPVIDLIGKEEWTED
jgi:hypothetical protein